MHHLMQTQSILIFTINREAQTLLLNGLKKYTEYIHPDPYISIFSD